MFSNFTSTLRRKLSSSPTTGSSGEIAPEESEEGADHPGDMRTRTGSSNFSQGSHASKAASSPAGQLPKRIPLPSSERYLARRQKRWSGVESKQALSGRISSSLGSQAQTMGILFSAHAKEVATLASEIRKMDALKKSLQNSGQLVDLILPEIEALENLLVLNHKKTQELGSAPNEGRVVESQIQSASKRSMHTAASNIDAAITSLSQRLSKSGTRNSSGLSRLRRASSKRDAIKIRTNSEASCGDSDSEDMDYMRDQAIGEI